MRSIASIRLQLLLVLVLAVLVRQSSSSSSQRSHDDLSFEFTLLNSTSLPKPLSDLTATLYGETVYLAGGCDAANGNVYDDTIKTFVCSSASDSLYAFSYRTLAVKELASMPVKRYRHAAVAVNGMLWLVGGRDTEADAIIGQVDVRRHAWYCVLINHEKLQLSLHWRIGRVRAPSDRLIALLLCLHRSVSLFIIPCVQVYDMAKDTWRSFDLPAKYNSSDLTGFPHNDLAFFAGGYDATYSTFLDTVFAINSTASLASSNASGLVIVDKAPLLVGRGDTASVTNDDEQYALVTGGFGSNEGFCAPEKAVDFYNFALDTWSSVAPVPIGRSDNALVELNGLVFSIGGERQVEGLCQLSDAEKPEPGEQTIPVDDVVVFDWTDRNWTLLSDLPEHRFRMAAVAVDEINTVYAFGGQTAYNSTCKCFKTSDDIIVYKQVQIDTGVSTSDGSSSGTSDAPASNLLRMRRMPVALGLSGVLLALVRLL
jgi:Kelch motif